MSNSNFVAGISGGKHVSGAPLTTDLAAAASPELLRNAIDKAIVKIRPMATPLDQISRLGHVRDVDSMVVDYYSVDCRKSESKVTAVSPDDSDDATFNDGCSGLVVTLKDTNVFEPSETFCVAKSDGTLATGYVVEKLDTGIRVRIATADKGEIKGGAMLKRLGRAATQLDVQSPQFSVLPRKQSNFCQIFKMQVEQSVIMKLSHKEIGWDFTDQQEAAVYDMRMGMERQFLFGQKMKVFDRNKQESVLLTQGIWEQAGKEIRADLGSLDAKALVDILRKTFTENSGSRRKILIAGSDVIAALNKIDAQRVITARDQVTCWGIDFSELISKFGRLYVVFSEVFDSMGMAGNGIIIDPEYIQKHVFIPMNAERLDLRGSGQRNTEAVVLTEASCLTLRYPEAHARLLGTV